MNIAIEARSLSTGGPGVQRYTSELIRHLLQNYREHAYTVLFAGKSSMNMFQEAREVVIPLPHLFALNSWMNRKVPRVLHDLKPDLVHFTKAAIPQERTVPTVVTIYDLMPVLLPESQSLMQRMYWKRALKHAAADADHIITISQASKDNISKFYDVDPGKITVTELAVDHAQFYPIADQKKIVHMRDKYRLFNSYILFVGTRHQRKNVKALLLAFQQLRDDFPHLLVIVGTKAQKDDGAERVIKKYALSDRVRVLDDVPHEDLPMLYTGADLFVWPSVYEGWGFPPQEAMACGTPVIVSDGGSLPEVVGDAGIIVSFSKSDLRRRYNDDAFVSQLAHHIRAVLDDKGVQREMRAKGLHRVREYTWQGVARKTIEVYKDVIRNP